ncbi:MAG: hypothetical protein CMP24_00015 [Rickettsiales bacterium]|nr:hypothetical protein [Rickettsiales bacterium]
MKYLFFIFYFFITNFTYSDDYIMNFQAIVKNLKEFNISKTEKFRSYEMEGTFTDNYGNYGKTNFIVISDTKNDKLLRLNATVENIYSNNEKLFIRGIREKSDVDAGVAYGLVIGATTKLKPLIGTKCFTSVKYFDDAIFGIQKCKLSETQTKVLKSLINQPRN